MRKKSIEKKNHDNMTPIEKAEHAQRMAEDANRISNFAYALSVVGVILTIIAYLDKIVLFVCWIQSCLR